MRMAAVMGVAAITAVGLAALTGCGTTRTKPPAAAASPNGPAYSYYRSVMGRLQGGGMMGDTGHGWMTGPGGYRWMMGGAASPAWMRGHAVPGFMMGGGTHDPGKIMGALWANGPGPRVSPAQAARLGRLTPAGATLDRAANRITFTGPTVRLVVLASPAGGRDETFRIAGLTNPAVTVPAGARVSIEIINADPGAAHGLVITAGQAAPSWMPMMTTRTAFPGAALWFLGNPTSAGMHAGTLTFTASPSGTYRYLCPVPGHAQKGMAGTFTVS
ncbi:MAG TPA: sulfocyanin-like copper-binding protein [Streptosporangiaceae bacterium]